MYSRNDPRVRRTLNQLSQNVASANESAQAGLFSFSHNYVNPCFSSIGSCVRSCTAPCFPRREDRLRRSRGRSRGRAELNFDFYDDWEEDENTGLLGWGSDEMDRLLSGSDEHLTLQQPERQRIMSYGTRRGDGRILGAKRRSAVQPHDGGPDPTVIPKTSMFGFLERLPWRTGRKGVKYKPSAADLQYHPGATRRRPGREGEPLIDESDEVVGHGGKGHRRNRSTTANSSARESLSSRGDIFPSEDELDDAVPLDDEFAMRLERRTTNIAGDESSSGKTRASERPSNSRTSTRTGSSWSTPSATKRKRRASAPTPDHAEAPMSQVPSMLDLRLEEDELKKQEEAAVERNRDAAQRLALERGLSTEEHPEPATPMSAEPGVKSTIPFPEFSSAEAAAQDSDAPAKALNAHQEPFIPAKLPHFPDSGG